MTEALEKNEGGITKYQKLHIPYDVGEDPDDGFSVIPC